MREESEGGDGEGEKGNTCGGPSQVLFSPSPQNLGSENVAGGREGRERAGAADFQPGFGEGAAGESSAGGRSPLTGGFLQCTGVALPAP